MLVAHETTPFMIFMHSKGPRALGWIRTLSKTHCPASTLITSATHLLFAFWEHLLLAELLCSP